MGRSEKKIRSVMHSLMVKNPQFVAESRTKLEEAAAKLEPMLDDPIFKGSKEGEEIAPGAIAVASLFQIMVCAPEFQRVGLLSEVSYLDPPRVRSILLRSWVRWLKCLERG